MMSSAAGGRAPAVACRPRYTSRHPESIAPGTIADQAIVRLPVGRAHALLSFFAEVVHIH